jgi:signal transduction histidine kinase
VLPTEYADAAVLLADSSLVDLDGRLVRLQGTLRGLQKQENLCVLEIDSGGVFLAASFPWEEGLPQLMRPGSVVALTGVCNLHLSEQRRRLGRTPNQMSLILQDSRELSLIKAAPWWDRTRLLNALAIAAALATLAGLWAAHASRRNSRLKQEIARREAAESRLSMERTRVAGDLHDTLEQTLLAADLQLSAAARSLEVQPKAVSLRLALVGQLLSRGRQEVREAVWDLHVGGGKPQPLGHLLNAACRDAAAAATAKIEFDGPQEEEPLLPAPLSAQLIRVVRESMTNALKHGAPKRVAVRLRYNSSQIEVTISDDGLGFSPEKAMGPASGHFGLSGMRERIQRLGGKFAIRSTPGMGVDVVLSVPIATS